MSLNPYVWRKEQLDKLVKKRVTLWSSSFSFCKDCKYCFCTALSICTSFKTHPKKGQSFPFPVISKNLKVSYFYEISTKLQQPLSKVNFCLNKLAQSQTKTTSIQHDPLNTVTSPFLTAVYLLITNFKKWRRSYYSALTQSTEEKW